MVCWRRGLKNIRKREEKEKEKEEEEGEGWNGNWRLLRVYTGRLRSVLVGNPSCFWFHHITWGGRLVGTTARLETPTTQDTSHSMAFSLNYSVTT
jgi:hypothetical protein